PAGPVRTTPAERSPRPLPARAATPRSPPDNRSGPPRDARRPPAPAPPGRPPRRSPRSPALRPPRVAAPHAPAPAGTTSQSTPPCPHPSPPRASSRRATAPGSPPAPPPAPPVRPNASRPSRAPCRSPGPTRATPGRRTTPPRPPGRCPAPSARRAPPARGRSARGRPCSLNLNTTPAAASRRPGATPRPAPPAARKICPRPPRRARLLPTASLESSWLQHVPRIERAVERGRVHQAAFQHHLAQRAAGGVRLLGHGRRRVVADGRRERRHQHQRTLDRRPAHRLVGLDAGHAGDGELARRAGQAARHLVQRVGLQRQRDVELQLPVARGRLHRDRQALHVVADLNERLAQH